MTGTPYGTRRFSGPLSSVVATCVSIPCWTRLCARLRTIALGPPRSGPTEGMTCRTFEMVKTLRLEKDGGEPLTEVFAREAALVSSSREIGPALPLGFLREQTLHGLGDGVRGIRIDRESALGRIHDLAASIEVADQAGTPHTHRFQ